MVASVVPLTYDYEWNLFAVSVLFIAPKVRLTSCHALLYYTIYLRIIAYINYY